MFSHFDRIPTCDGRTVGRTDIQMARGTNILGQHSPRYAYASRDKSGYSCTREIVRVVGKCSRIMQLNSLGGSTMQ